MNFGLGAFIVSELFSLHLKANQKTQGTQLLGPPGTVSKPHPYTL